MPSLSGFGVEVDRFDLELTYELDVNSGIFSGMDSLIGDIAGYESGGGQSRNILNSQAEFKPRINDNGVFLNTYTHQSADLGNIDTATKAASDNYFLYGDEDTPAEAGTNNHLINDTSVGTWNTPDDFELRHKDDITLGESSDSTADSSGDSAPTPEFTTVQLPTLLLPEIKVPEFNLNGFDLSGFSLFGTALSGREFYGFQIPDFEIPEFGVPDFSWVIMWKWTR